MRHTNPGKLKSVSSKDVPATDVVKIDIKWQNVITIKAKRTLQNSTLWLCAYGSQASIITLKNISDR